MNSGSGYSIANNKQNDQEQRSTLVKEYKRLKLNSNIVISIKVLTKDDYPEILNLQNIVAQETSRDIYVTANEDQFNTAIENGSGLGAYINKKLIGFVGAYSPDNLNEYFKETKILFDSNDHCVEVFYSVDKNYRGYRIIPELLSHTTQIEKTRGTQHLTATVHPENIPSIKILFNAGFQICFAGKMYGGKPRLMLYKNLQKQQSTDFIETQTVVASDLETQQKFIEQGFIGTEIKADTELKFQYKK